VELTVPAAPGRARQMEVYLAGVRGRKPRVPVDYPRLEEAARRKLSPRAFAYVAGGAGMERTMAANLAAFERRRIVPRMLRDVSTRDVSVALLGRRLASPFLLAPVGALELVHREADAAVARAAAAAGVPMIFSSQASRPMEECAALLGQGPRWFQLYWSTLDDVAASFVSRAEACGCEAIVLTLDTTVLGWRCRDLDLAHLPFAYGQGIAQYTSDPAFTAGLGPAPLPRSGRPTLAAIRWLLRVKGRYPGGLRANLRSDLPFAAVRQFMETYSRPSLTWADLAWLRGLTGLPIVLKGILHPDDARLAVEHGVDGIVVSNHGGRQVDGALGSLDALPGVVEAVGGRIPVLLDSGIRTGADAFKALALGATAVLIGRPYVYGLALAGEEGVREVIRNLVAEFDLTLGLSGCASTAEIGPQCLQSVP
jgi:isopentenyl diphosphate isomerase/L-lactate dehydrogenase-like FMN-dependent dehydrogenase